MNALQLSKSTWPQSIWDFDPLFDVPSFFSTNAHYTPKVNLFNEPNNYLLEVLVPGAKKEDIDICLEGRKLSISGQVEARQMEALKQEIRYGEFRRILTLPQDIIEEEIDASMENGVLSITLPKVTKNLPEQKTISIT